MKPKVTIITPYYNRADCVEESVQSLVTQTYKNCNLLLVDDGSKDDTRERFEKFRNEKNVTIVSGPNRGLTRALAETVASATDSDYIAIHGSGDISLPTRIEQQVEALETNVDWALTGCWLDNVSEDGTRSAYHRRTKPVQADDLIERNFFTHGEVMFRKSCYEEVGGYRSNFPMAQDIDLWLRMLQDRPGGFAQDVLYERKIRSDGIEKNPSKKLIQMQLANLARKCHFMRKHCGEDALQRFGEYGAMLLSGSPDLAKRLRNATHNPLVKGTDLERVYLVMAAINELYDQPYLIDPYLTDPKVARRIDLRSRIARKLSKIF